MKDEVSEYYALDPDDGLTMSLGVNPLLQFGVVEARKTPQKDRENDRVDFCGKPV